MDRGGLGHSKRNLSTKALLQLVSFILAVGLWFYVISSEPLIVEKKLPLEFIAPEGVTISNLIEKEVVVKLRGPRVFLRNLFNSKDRIYLNLNHYQYRLGQKFSVLLDESDIPIPLGVKVLEIRPTEIQLSLEKLVERKIPVSATLAGEIASELKLVHYEVVPEYILISGPKNVVRKMDKVFTAPIDIGSLQGEGSVKVGLEELDPRIKIKAKREIDFQFEVRPKKANFTLKNIKIRYLSSQRRLKSDVLKVALDVLVPEDLGGIKESEVQVVADIPEGFKDKTRVKLKAILPDGVHLLKIHPESINVEILNER